VSLRDLDIRDLGVVSRLYEILKSTYQLWLYMDEEIRNDQLIWERLRELLQSSFVSEVCRLGAGRLNYPKLVCSALEDTKWGALGPLCSQLQQHRTGPVALRAGVLLARDQAKIMRNAFFDLDPVLREADESHKAHHIAGMVNKVADISPNIEAVLDWEGSVSSRCLETSTVDRVLYDFLRRIERTGPSHVVLWVGAINKELTRWALKFECDGFAPHEPDDLATVAVSKSVGLTPEAALERGYLGARDGWAWFHWPVFNPRLGEPVCACDI
jgi:hypothetical protein